MRVHKLTFAAALAVAATLSLTACNDGDATGQGGSASTTSASASGGDTGSSASGQGDAGRSGGDENSGGKSSSSDGQGTAAGSGSNEDSGVGKCRTDDLDITATDSTIGGDTEGSVAVTLKNGGGGGCVLSGFAGVDLKTSEGALSAKRTGEPADRMVLKSGESVSFGISYPMNDSGGSGVKVTGLVVTPPGETKSFTLAWPGQDSLPVTDGSGSPVEVGPIGSAGQGG
ncbi:DUF4232 domain-containing protein [Streptomyces tsukubensis]|uniref:DUF4232 domain-containing protein n=1 Tax=Streptomyces tsukubensis TaxID=83656 RepID=A0A1V4A991_9ACTN|nr:DUF4232 domain-containing protein [Streptomyces tsukubensis]OON78790.1 hypothetical protein B1H18_15565 [Streptomyces tsukubensis]QFR94266.1 DUF4232 domain-containing protein [Streptomyces tsukubensis]